MDETDSRFPSLALMWGPVAVAVAATGAALVLGDRVLDVAGVPPSRWWWWPTAALGWAVHTDLVHLVGNVAVWWWATRAALHTTFRWRRVAGVAVGGFVAGAAVWAVFGDGRPLVGLSGAVCAVCALVAVAGSGRDRWVAGGLVALFLLPWAGTSWRTHAAGALVGAVAGLLAGPGARSGGAGGGGEDAENGGDGRGAGGRTGPGPDGAGDGADDVPGTGDGGR